MGVRIEYLRGRLVCLRPWEPADADWLWGVVNNDEEVRRLTGTQVPFTRSQIEVYIRGQGSDDTRVAFAIVCRQDDATVGEVVLNQISARNRSANLRIFVESARTERGYGSEAARLMLDYGFGMLNLHRVELDVYTINARARHVYEKLGFTVEGVRRQSWYYDHAYLDAMTMSVLAHEWGRADPGLNATP